MPRPGTRRVGDRADEILTTAEAFEAELIVFGPRR